jgi:hypothetical protein
VGAPTGQLSQEVFRCQRAVAHRGCVRNAVRPCEFMGRETGAAFSELREKWKRLRHWLCSSHQLLRGSQQRGYMHRRSP